MKLKILLCAAAMVFAGVALPEPFGGAPARASAPVSGESPLPQSQDGQGKALLETVCAQCHSIDVAVSPPRSRDEWTDVVSRMVGNGAQLSDDDYSLIIEYLTLHHGLTAPSAPAK